jgi:hypothetical protein
MVGVWGEAVPRYLNILRHFHFQTISRLALTYEPDGLLVPISKALSCRYEAQVEAFIGTRFRSGKMLLTP